MPSTVPIEFPGIGSLILFVVLIAATVGAFIWAHQRSATTGDSAALRNVGLFAILWLALTGALPLAKLTGPQTAITIQTISFALMLLVIITSALSRYGKRMALGLPMVFLVGVQVYRLPLELVLHQWWEDGFLPIQMTYLGDNFDILTGIFAIPAALLAWIAPKIRWPLWLFNIFGLVLLARIIVIVNLSNPTPLKAAFGGYQSGPDVVLGLYFPYVWIASVAVGAAIFFHIVALRKLWSHRRV